MPSLSLTLLNDTYTIHRLSPQVKIPATALDSPFFAITRTDNELSIVVPERVEIKSAQSEPGWACFKVDGPLEFSQTGILAGLASTLADARVSIFAVSTFDTDYLFVKREQVEVVKEALKSADYLLSP